MLKQHGVNEGTKELSTKSGTYNVKSTWKQRYDDCLDTVSWLGYDFNDEKGVASSYVWFMYELQIRRHSYLLC